MDQHKRTAAAALVIAGAMAACGGDGDAASATMAKDLAVAPPQATAGQAVYPQVPEKGTAEKEVARLKNTGVPASELGCSSYSPPSTGWPTFVVLVEVPQKDMDIAASLGYYEVRNSKDLAGTRLLEAPFPCASRNL